MMTKNLALAASIAMLAAISGLASARAAGPYTRDWPVVTGRSDQQVLRAFNASYSAMAWAAHVPAPAKTSTSPRKDGSLNRSGHRQAAAVGAMARVIPAIRARAQRPIACPPVHAGLF
jgi:hypothetical protein